MELTAGHLRRLFQRLLQVAEQNQGELDALDAVAADGDHGATFVLGWRAVGAGLDSTAKATPGALLLRAAADFASVGGSIGPLWGTALLRAGKALEANETISSPLAATAVQAAVRGIAERGGAQAGDKTLLDTLVPASEAFSAAVATGREWAALEDGLAAARAGAAGTRALLARRGRSRRLAERTLGQLDPGAASAYLVWATAAWVAGGDQPSLTPLAAPQESPSLSKGEAT